MHLRFPFVSFFSAIGYGMVKDRPTEIAKVTTKRENFIVMDLESL